MEKRLSALLANCNIRIISIINPDAIDTLIEGIAYDSRQAGKNYAFFALSGIHADGHEYISAAVANGATAVFVSSIPENIGKHVAIIQVEDTRRAMAFFSAAFFGNPADKLKIIGVTGTDGKSTTVSFVYQLLNFLGKKAGFISTVDYDCGRGPEKNPYRQSTPEAPEIMRILAGMVENSFEYAVIESTSHGLSEKTSRLSAISYNAGILTNVTHEHLEFHGTMENYINDKANLFRKSTNFCVINYNEPNKNAFIKAAATPLISYSLDNANADIFASDIETSESGSSFSVNCSGKFSVCSLGMPGAFNIENFLAAAVTVSRITGTDIWKVLLYGPGLRPVNGRMETVAMGQDFTVIVDYAHTPGAFTKIFPMIRKTVKKRLIAVFGSAGERDIEKRAVQGEIASCYSDILILTDEDPRKEDQMSIINQIASGIKSGFDVNSIYKIPDRQEAINKAISLASAGDTVMLLGKGHEASIIYSNGSSPWNEKEAAVKALISAGWGNKADNS